MLNDVYIARFYRRWYGWLAEVDTEHLINGRRESSWLTPERFRSLSKRGVQRKVTRYVTREERKDSRIPNSVEMYP
jgi:hypothetical protein